MTFDDARAEAHGYLAEHHPGDDLLDGAHAADDRGRHFLARSGLVVRVSGRGVSCERAGFFERAYLRAHANPSR